MLQLVFKLIPFMLQYNASIQYSIQCGAGVRVDNAQWRVGGRVGAKQAVALHLHVTGAKRHRFLAEPSVPLVSPGMLLACAS